MKLSKAIPEHRNEIILLSIIAGLLAAQVSGTSGLLDRGVEEGSEENVKIVASELIGFEPMSYAISHRKVPEPEGLNIELKTASFTAASLNTLTTSEPVLGVVSNTRLVKAYNNNKEFEVMAPWYREGMCGYREMTVGQLVTAKNSSVKEPEDLYGKEVGLIGGRTGGSAMALQTALRSEDVNLSRIEFRGVTSENAPILVREGKLAASMFDSSYIVTPEYDRKYRTVMDFGEVLHDTYGAVPPSQFVVVRENYYEENPEKFEKGTQWLRDNYEWSRDNMEEISRIRSEGEGEAAGKSVDLLTKKSTCFSRIGEFREEDKEVLRNYYETAEEVGAIESIPDLDSVFDGAVSRSY